MKKWTILAVCLIGANMIYGQTTLIAKSISEKKPRQVNLTQELRRVALKKEVDSSPSKSTKPVDKRVVLRTVRPQDQLVPACVK